MKISYGQTMVCGLNEEVRRFLREGQATSEMPFTTTGNGMKLPLLLSSGSSADMDIQWFIAPFPYHPT